MSNCPWTQCIEMCRGTFNWGGGGGGVGAVHDVQSTVLKIDRKRKRVKNVCYVLLQ